MRDIKDVFDAAASSVQATFKAEMGVASFRVPIYQRQYSWEQQNIERLLEDIHEGLMALRIVKDSLTFIGTIILVDDNPKKEQTFDGQSLSVVDGQQRLTTLAVICITVYQAIRQQLLSSDEWPNDEVSSAIKEEAKYLCDLLFACCIGSPSGPGITTAYDYFPRIVREETDKRASTADEARYNSLIASYLFGFCEHVLSDSQEPFRFTPDDEGEVYDSFMNRIKVIQRFHERILDVESEDLPFPSFIDLLEQASFRQALFPKIQQRTDRIEGILDAARDATSHPAYPCMRLIAFGNFLLYRVAITRVIADEERYAFDIFEALNTTGEPLTAIETFKPQVIQFEEGEPRRFLGSTSYKALELVQSYLASRGSYDAQQKEAREIVVLLALYATGQTEGYHLSSQRRYLRQQFNVAHGKKAKRRFVRALADVAEFRRRFWSKSELPNQLRQHAEKEVVLCCLDFIRDLGNSLTIPVLLRYWKESERHGNFDLFADAVKSVTAFLVLRRAGTGGTEGIDSDYRHLMSDGGRTEADGRDPMMIGLGSEQLLLPDIDTLNKYLLSYLHRPKLKMTTKADWLRRVSQQPLYRPISLCKFILLCAAHNSVPRDDKPYLLKKDRQSHQRDYLNLNRWRAVDFGTIEHIAPQTRTNGWSQSLYDDLNLIHLLGNLTLLPEKENVSIGNKPWNKKKLFYRAAAADTDDEVEQFIQQARSEGMDFGKGMNDLLRQGPCLPVLSTVASVEEWNSDIVRERTENIAQLLWDEVSPWLGLE